MNLDEFEALSKKIPTNNFPKKLLKNDTNYITMLDKLKNESENLMNTFNDIQSKNANLENLITEILALKGDTLNNTPLDFKRIYNYNQSEFFPNLPLKAHIEKEKNDPKLIE